jgi:hypothetical protein
MKSNQSIKYFGAVVFSLAMITAATSVIGQDQNLETLRSDAVPILNTNNVQPIQPLMDPGDIIFSFSPETPTGDNGCLGVEFDGTNFWVTGRDSPGGDIHKLHKFDSSFNHIITYEQGTTSTWGWRDLAWDGEYLYASDENELVKIDPATGAAIEFLTKPPGFETVPCRGLAYDPATDHFYTANWASPIVEFDRSGNIINSYSNDLSVYGLAWDAVSEGGPYLWVHSQDEIGDAIETLVSQVDPTTGIPTGVQFVGWNNPGADNNLAGGAAFVDDWTGDGDPVFIGLTQSSPDTVFGMDISVPNMPELEITGISGGVGATATIKNIGNADATSVDWTITLDGGLVIIGKEKTGTIATLAPEASQEIKTGLVFGIGRPTITVAAESAEGAIVDGSASGFLLLFLLLGVA